MLRVIGLTLLFAALALRAGAAAPPPDRFDGQYMGELILTKEITDCTRPPLGAIYPLTVAGGHVRFNYAPRFNTTLVGAVDERGILKASAKLRRGRVIQMTGRIQGASLTATITSPSCRYNFQTRN